jgi:hypothetical protein
MRHGPPRPLTGRAGHARLGSARSARAPAGLNRTRRRLRPQRQPARGGHEAVHNDHRPTLAGPGGHSRSACRTRLRAGHRATSRDLLGWWPGPCNFRGLVAGHRATSWDRWRWCPDTAQLSGTCGRTLRNFLGLVGFAAGTAQLPGTCFVLGEKCHKSRGVAMTSAAQSDRAGAEPAGPRAARAVGVHAPPRSVRRSRA